MKAITSARSWASSMMFGMERWEVSSATLSAIADMPLVLAMALRVGARKLPDFPTWRTQWQPAQVRTASLQPRVALPISCANACLLYTSDAADEEDSVDLGGRRIIKKK